MRKVATFVRRYGLIIAICAFVGGVTAFAYSARIPDLYRTAVVLEPVHWHEYYAGPDDGRELEAFVAAINSHGFADSYLTEPYRHTISIEVDYRSPLSRGFRAPKPTSIKITATGSQPEEIATLLGEWSNAVVEFSRTWEKETTALPLRATGKIYTPAAQIYPNRGRNTMAGLTAGLLFGLALVVLIRGEL